MAIQGINAVVGQLQATALQAGQLNRAAPVAESGFASELRSAIDRISENQLQARKQAQDFSMGVEGVALNDVMVDSQKAAVSLQFGVQMRNRLVSAYQEIMSMSV